MIKQSKAEQIPKITIDQHSTGMKLQNFGGR
jgi:hypothetical protein